MQKHLARACIVLLLVPGPAFSQNVRLSPAQGNAAVVSPVPAVNDGLSLDRLDPGLAAPALDQQLPSLLQDAQLPQLPVAPGLDPAPTAASNPSVPIAVAVEQSASPREEAPAQRLHQAAAALAQDEDAGRELPALAALGSPAPAPDAGASLGEQSAAASVHFNAKAGLPSEARAPAADAPVDVSAGAGGSGRGSGRGRRRKKDDEPPPDPKYPSRPVEFDGHVFPSVAFRPDRPIEPLIVEAIDSAKLTLRIALYEFKSQAILQALRRAKKRGVDIEIIVDFENVFPRQREDSDYIPTRSLEMEALFNEGFQVTILKGLFRYGILHNKFAVVDGGLAFFGSYNWSYTSERNHWENIVFTKDKKDIDGLLAYWDYMRGLSVPFKEARDYTWPNEAPPPPADAHPSVSFNGMDFPAWVFSPGGAAEGWLIQAIDRTEKSIDLSMFTFRSTKVLEALLRAKERGVKVRAVFDESQTGQPFMKAYVDWLAFHGVSVKTIAGPNPDGPEYAEKNHNKFMVLDGKMVETGSMNHTKNAFFMNFENLFFLADPTDVSAYLGFFNDQYKNPRAEKVEAPEAEPALPSDEELLRELQVPSPPLPPNPTFPALPNPGQVRFHNETFPAAAVKPQDPVKDYLVKAIDASEKYIRLALYELTLPEVLDALRRAKERKVDIELILDYSHVFPRGIDHTGAERQRSPQIQALIDEGFKIHVRRGLKSQSIMHNKLGIFDGLLVELGSYNWAKTAEENHFENVIFSAEKARVDFYEGYWNWMRDASLSVSDADPATHKRVRWPDPGPAPVDEDLALEFNGQRFPRSAVSPEGLVEETIIRAIKAAKTSIDIAMFAFYSVPIAEALLEAKEKGVAVRLVIDRQQAKLMKLDDWFSYHDFDIRLTAGPDRYGNVYFEKNHNKFMLIDGRFLATGSYNYSAVAEHGNFDNANFFLDKLLAAFYAAYFAMLYAWGYKPLKPKRPPDIKRPGAEFFSPDARPEVMEGAQSFHFEWAPPT